MPHISGHSSWEMPGSALTGDALGGFFRNPISVQETFAGSPESLWQAARIGSLSDQQAYLPQFQRAAMAGYQPAFGSYLMAQPGGQQTFAQYMNNLGAASGAHDLPVVGATGDQWANAMTASRYLGDPTSAPANLPAQTLDYQGLLQGANARTNALAMTAAAMGGGAGYGAQARNAAVGNLYDLYAARSAAAGQSPGGFLNWMGQRFDPAR